MRPPSGIAVELAALVLVLVFAYLASGPGLLSSLALLVAQGATTYLVHCPAHYLVGRGLGVRFSRFGFGTSTLTRVLPPRLRSLASLIPIAFLVVEKGPATRASPRRLGATYAAGIVASSASAFIFAGWVALTGTTLSLALTSVFAFAYLVSDLVASPRTGDLMRARKALGQASSG